MRFTRVLLLTALQAVSFGETSPVPDSKVDWLSKNAFAVRSIDPQDGDFADLVPLKKIIGDARIVQLGEQSHGDGATFFAKARLVRFLHEYMGFDVLAWESGLFDCEEMNRAFESGMPATLAARKGVFAIWSRSGHVLPLFDYASSSWFTSRPLRQTGIDVQDFSSGDLNRYFELIDTVDSNAVSAGDRKILTAFFAARFPKYQPSNEDRAERQASFRRIVEALRFRAESAKDPRVADLLCKAAENIAALEELFSFGPVSLSSPVSQIKFRDVKMGDNLLWLAQKRYAKDKIIVWAASRHIAYDLPGIDTRMNFTYQGWETMGDVVHRQLKKGVYTIGFTAYEGSSGIATRPEAQALAKPDPASLESLWHATKMPYAFVDFRGLARDHWLRKPILSRPFGYKEMLAVWPNHVDGMFYTDAMFPSTAKGDVPPGVRTKSVSTP